ncbi:MAG: RNA methyltransferase [Candidatus Delongbacteria bacterium]|nr:RNA methyltransferase [Candidatus Delongbacteria bacterium]
MEPFITPERKNRIERVLARRTDNAGFILDGLIDWHNISAILRTSEALGLGRLYIIPGEIEKNMPSRAVSKNSHKWLDIENVMVPPDFLIRKKQEGFEIWLADGGPESLDLGTISIPDRVLVVMGNEHRGGGPEIRALADHRVAIPILGFMESYNVSVAAAIMAYHLRDHHSFEGLSRNRYLELKHRFYRQSVRHADLLIRNRR